jgi:hypothetical protein
MGSTIELNDTLLLTPEQGFSNLRARPAHASFTSHQTIKNASRAVSRRQARASFYEPHMTWKCPGLVISRPSK